MVPPRADWRNQRQGEEMKERKTEGTHKEKLDPEGARENFLTLSLLPWSSRRTLDCRSLNFSCVCLSCLSFWRAEFLYFFSCPMVSKFASFVQSYFSLYGHWLLVWLWADDDDRLATHTDIRLEKEFFSTGEHLLPFFPHEDSYFLLFSRRHPFCWMLVILQ